MRGIAWLLTLQARWTILHSNEKGGAHASLLCEVSIQKGDERRQGHQNEEWQAGDPRHLPDLRDEDVQDWESLELTADSDRYYRKGWGTWKDPSLFLVHVLLLSEN